MWRRLGLISSLLGLIALCVGLSVAVPTPASARTVHWVNLHPVYAGYPLPGAPSNQCSVSIDRQYSSCAPVGWIHAGRNYVYCKSWGGNFEYSDRLYNHWWLKTDLDVVDKGHSNPAWISAFFLTGPKNSRNDTAFDVNGHEIPNC